MVNRFLQRSWAILLDILFPPVCLRCETRINADTKQINADKNSSKKIICDNCYRSIKLNATLFCGVCRARLPENKKICHPKARYLLAAASNYDDPVLQNLIHYFKYRSFQSVAPILGEILIEYLEEIILHSEFEILNYVVIPIPLHSARERRRGFNQAQLLSEIIAHQWNLKMENVLKRTKNNKPQVGLRGNDERRKNMENCFAILNPLAISNKNIILVDDVITSGATLNEAARILKENGARKILALVVAKA